jgi:hypothetical protein
MTFTPSLGDIGLTQIGGRVGFGVKVGQWLNGDGFVDVQHAFIVVAIDSRGTWIVEAEPGGARQVYLTEYDDDRVYWLQCPEESRLRVAQAARNMVGVPYSFLDYGSLAVHRFHIPTPMLKRYIANSGHMICSQLVDHAALQGEWHLFEDNRWEGDVTPGDLFKLWKLTPQQFRTP